MIDPISVVDDINPRKISGTKLLYTDQSSEDEKNPNPIRNVFRISKRFPDLSALMYRPLFFIIKNKSFNGFSPEGTP